MKRKVIVVLELMVEDLTMPERREAAAEGDCKESEIPRLGDIASEFWGEALEDYLLRNDPEFYAGTNNYAKVIKAKSDGMTNDSNAACAVTWGVAAETESKRVVLTVGDNWISLAEADIEDVIAMLQSAKVRVFGVGQALFKNPGPLPSSIQECPECAHHNIKTYMFWRYIPTPGHWECRVCNQRIAEKI
jgi:hypothetical protein